MLGRTSICAKRLFQTKLYETHIPTNIFQKTILTAGSAISAFINPERGDLVAVLGETTGHCALEAMRDAMRASPVGSRILAERPFVSSKTVDLDALRAYPKASFGRAYVDFLDGQQVTPDTRSEVRFVDDAELAYVILRYRHVHDYLHALMGLDISVKSELILKAYEAIQCRLPSTVLSAVAGPAMLSFQDKIEFATKGIAYGVRLGLQTENFMNIYYEEIFHEPVEDVRRRYGFEVYK